MAQKEAYRTYNIPRGTMKNILLILILVILLGCAQQPSTPKTVDHSANIGRTSSVIVAEPGLVVAQHSSFAWLPNTSLVKNDAPFDVQTIQGMIKDAIKVSLSAKGYQFIPSDQQSDFLVTFTVALESGASDQTLTKKYGLTPGLRTQGDTTGMEKGTIIIDIVQIGSKRSLWRGALQGLAQLELDDTTRRKRINAVVDDLLSKFP